MVTFGFLRPKAKTVSMNFLNKHDRIFIAILGILIGVFFSSSYLRLMDDSGELPEKRQGLVGFINPVLECGESVKGFGLKIYGFEERFKSYIEKNIQNQKEIKIVSLYFKDLNNGSVIGINDDLPFLGGSLLKVPLMIGYFKIAESKPDYLDQKILFKDEKLLKLYDQQEIDPAKTLKIGEKYTLFNLIERAVINSDNVAAFLLESFDMDASLKSVVREMDISISPKIAPYRDMTVKEYAGFFRILYNATYLNRVSSNTALEILSRATQNKALRAGVPETFVVSHKFGEFVSLDQKDLIYNDCGIIYLPKTPYLLCVSTTGNSYPVQIESIKKISSFVFSEVSKL